MTLTNAEYAAQLRFFAESSNAKNYAEHYRECARRLDALSVPPAQPQPPPTLTQAPPPASVTALTWDNGKSFPEGELESFAGGVIDRLTVDNRNVALFLRDGRMIGLHAEPDAGGMARIWVDSYTAAPVQPAGPVLRFKVLPNRPANLPLPAYQTEGAAGFDIQSAVEATLGPGATFLVATGLAVEIPPGFELQIRPRSGLALKHRVTVLNSPATVDSDYRGEVGVLLHNADSHQAFRVEPGQRIAQLVLAPVARMPIVQAAELSATGRGAGGFGHTGL